jgi:hypothetical protein
MTEFRSRVDVFVDASAGCSLCGPWTKHAKQVKRLDISFGAYDAYGG